MYYPPLNDLVTEQTFSTFVHDLVVEKTFFLFFEFWEKMS